MPLIDIGLQDEGDGILLDALKARPLHSPSEGTKARLVRYRRVRQGD
jgi:hypothetical protein